jgi:ATP-dependent DNA helicase RecG
MSNMPAASPGPAARQGANRPEGNMGRNLNELVARLRKSGCGTQTVEVKASVGKLPKSMVETVSAFANSSGGTIILGLSEADGFTRAAGFSARGIYDALASACADRLTPAVRAAIEIEEFEGGPVVVASVAELHPADKPCYVTERGMYKGSFIRTDDGDRLLTPYEIDRLVEERRQPRHDLEPVPEASPKNLDAALVAGLLARQRATHPRIFAALSDEDALLALNVLVRDNGELVPTLAGLLALGTYPQQFFPRLTVTFACYAGMQKAEVGGVKYAGSETMAGPVPAVLEDTLRAVRRNMRVGGALEGGLRRDVPDYPLNAVREAVCNALMHRDYSPMGRGAQVQVNMYADRLEVLSPGGLYGAVTVDTLGEAGVSSTRNAALAALMETTPYADGGFVAENRGTGFQLIQAELEANGMRPPVVVDKPSMFSITLFRRGGQAGAASTGSGCTEAGFARPELSQTDPVLGFMEGRGFVRAAEVSQGTGVPRSTVAYRLSRYIAEGRVEARGSLRSPQRQYRLVAGSLEASTARSNGG